jgi:hypothetical protein
MTRQNGKVAEQQSDKAILLSVLGQRHTVFGTEEFRLFIDKLFLYMKI